MNAPYYFACLLNDDGTASTGIDFGGSANEQTAGRIAVRLANAEQHDACVVRRIGEQEEIVSRVSYHPGERTAEAEPSQVAPTKERYYLSLVKIGEPAAVDFMLEYLHKGFVITVSLSKSSAPLVNMVAHR